MIFPSETEPGFHLESAYEPKQDLPHQGQDETFKSIMEHQIGGVNRFTKTGIRGFLVAGVRGESSFVDSFDAVKREAKLLARLDHPNIVKVNDLRVSEDGQQITMILPFLRGSTLDVVADQLGGSKGGLKIKLGIMRQIASALDYCHSQGIIYADMKMACSMVELLPDEDGRISDGKVVMIDFGQAIDIHNPHPIDGTRFTPKYASIEQRMHSNGLVSVEEVKQPIVDHQAFGLVLYEFLTGKPAVYKNLPYPMDSVSVFKIQGLPKEVSRLMQTILSERQIVREQIHSLSAFMDEVEKAYFPRNKSPLALFHFKRG